MTIIGDTTLTIKGDPLAAKVEVLSKASREGVYVRVWGEHDNMLHRLDITADEALLIASALTRAANASIRFTAGLPR
jgi:hypothetical protein